MMLSLCFLPKLTKSIFSPEQKVKLITPRITTDGYKIGERGFVNYILLADDIVLKNEKVMLEFLRIFHKDNLKINVTPI